MRLYEATYILAPELEEEQIGKAQEKYSEMIKKGGGEIVNIDNWGKRKLAYEVNGKTEGTYIIMKFNSPSEAAENMVKIMKIADEVVKTMLLRLN